MGQARSPWTAALLLAVALPLGSGPTSAEEPAPGAPPSAVDTTIPWDEAEKHVGEEVTVSGKVVDAHCSPLNCLLAFEPGFNRFTAVIPAQRFADFPPERVSIDFVGKWIHVRGKVVEIDRKPEIIVDVPDALRITRAERRRERDAQRQEELASQAEALDRLDEALARVEQLTERLGETEARLQTLLALLDQRVAQLAATQAQPPAPTHGEPQPRPAYEALRTVKRGMGRDDVQRLVGAPEYVEYGSGGWQTWYYGFGRSVSFDRRGRAQALIGFPQP